MARQISPGLSVAPGAGAPALTAYRTRALSAALSTGALSLAFAGLPAGNANGVAGLRVLAGTATLGSTGLTVDADFSSAWNGTQIAVADLRGGTLSRTVEEGQTYMFGARDPGTGWQVTLWSAGGQFGSNDEFGFVNATVGRSVRPRGTLPIPAGRRHIELSLPPTLAYGAVVEVRRWADGTPRPDAATASFTIGQQTAEAPDPTDVGALTVIGLNSIGSPAAYRDVQATPANSTAVAPEVATQVVKTAAWVSKRLNGQDYLACIAQGNELISWVTGTRRAGWVVTTPAGADYPSRAALYVDGRLQGVYDCPIGTEATLNVDLPDTRGHLVSLVVSGTHEGGGDSKLWSGIHGLYVRRLDVGSGAAQPPADQRRQVMAISDSTGAAIVARGHATSGPPSQPSQSAGELGWPITLGRTLGAAVTCCCWGGQGLMQGGNGGVPAAPAALGLAMSGAALDWSSGLPSDIVIGHGANDYSRDPAAFQAVYRAYIAQVRAAYPLAQVWLLAPLAGQQAAAVAQVAADTGCLLYTATGLTFVDGTHPNTDSTQATGQQEAGQLRAGRGAAYWDGGASLPSPRIPLTLLNGWVAREGAPPPVVYKSGGQVFVQAIVSNSKGDSTIAVLPEGFRPVGEIVVYSPSVEGSVLVAINDKGQLGQFGGSNSSTRLTVIFNFPA